MVVFLVMIDRGVGGIWKYIRMVCVRVSGDGPVTAQMRFYHKLGCLVVDILCSPQGYSRDLTALWGTGEEKATPPCSTTHLRYVFLLFWVTFSKSL